MTILYFGDYDPKYSRTRVILNGLASERVKVIHVNVRKKKGLSLLWNLYKGHAAVKEEYDVLFIGVGDSRVIPLLARLIARAPIVWEPLFSIYDNWVFDRKLVSPHSPKAYWYWLLDWIDCRVADLIILDTKTNVEYFSRTFGIPMRKLSTALVGADTQTFIPMEKTKKSAFFEIEFHGKYIPVQGTDIIVRAAKLLENDAVHFTMIGGGQAFAETKKLAEELHVSNVTFLPFLPQAEVVEYIRNADACVGLVGDVPRVVRAIPNKLYEAAAMARVSINADTSSLREVFTPSKDTIGVRAGDAKDFAHAVRELKEKANTVELGKAAYETFMRHATPELVAKKLIHDISKIAILHA